MDMLRDFELIEAVSPQIIESYRGRLPDEMLNRWTGQGFGSGVNGFMKIINPDIYLERLKGCLPDVGMIPVFATGLGDLIVHVENAYINLLFRYGVAVELGASLRHLGRILTDDDCVEDFFEWNPYSDAVERYGSLEYDQCFGYVPLLALGGTEEVENLKKVQIFEHIQFIVQMAGPITLD